MLRKSILASAVLGALALATAGYAAGPAKPPHMPKVDAEMKKVVDPTSMLLFTIGSEVDPENGPDLKPIPAARWNKAVTAANTLKSAGEWLRAPGNGKKNAEWIKYAAELTTLSDKAATAAKARNGKDLAQAANDMSDNCAACHKMFKPQTG